MVGYDLVGNGVDANFLVSLSYDRMSKTVYYILNVSYLMSLVFAYPLTFFGCRNNFIALAKLALLK